MADSGSDALSGAATGTMIAPGVGTAIGAGAGILGGIIGGIASSGDAQQAQQLQQEAAALYSKFGPVDLSNPIVFQQFSQAGLLSPTMEQALNLNMSKNESIQENAGDLTQQKAALGALKQLSQTGLSAQDIASARQLTNQVGSDTQAKTAQLLQQAQQRGQGDSGSTLAAQLAANQQGSQQESNQADQLAAQGSSARAQALSQLFAGTGQVRQQDTDTQKFNTQNDILRSQFLDQNAAARQQANTNATNQASLYNTQRQQSVADRNTQQSNAELLREENAKQQAFENQMQYAGAQSNALNNQANNLTNQGNNTRQSWSNIGQGVGQTTSAYGNYQAKQPTQSYNSYQDPTSYGSSNPYAGDQSEAISDNAWAAHGGFIGGQPNQSGDHIENDTVNLHASPGELVIPRTMANSPEHAKAFVDQAFANPGKSEKENLMDILHHMNKRLHHLESK